jgi:hypothetical protein
MDQRKNILLASDWFEDQFIFKFLQSTSPVIEILNKKRHTVKDENIDLMI